jgi:serine/threonine protein kinase
VPSVNLNPAGPALFNTEDVVGKWIIEQCISPAIPPLYRVHRKDDPDTIGQMQIWPLKPHNVDRLRREARILRDLDHPAIPRLIDFGQSGALQAVWIVTDFFDGDPVSDLLMQGPLDWKEACVIALQIAECMRHMHSHGIVHHDVNPNKVIVDPDKKARLVGFEMAMSDLELARAARVDLGVLSYVAPEVLNDPEHLGERADLYALGVVFYELLTSRPAFPAALIEDELVAAHQMLEWKTHAEPLDPGDEVPSWLGNLIRKATHPEPEQRLPDMDAFVGWLEAAEAAFAEAKAVATAAAPPPIAMNLAPTIKAPEPSIRVEAPLAPPPTPPIVVYISSLIVGCVAGLAFSLLIILFAEVVGFG